VRRSVGLAMSRRQPARQAEFGLELVPRPGVSPSAQLVLWEEFGQPVARQARHSVGAAARPGSQQVPGAALVQPPEARLVVLHAAELPSAARVAAVGQPAAAARDVVAALLRAEASAPDVLVRPRAEDSGVPVRRPVAEEPVATVEPVALAVLRAAAEQAAWDAQVPRPEEVPEAELREAWVAGLRDAREQQAEPPLREAARPWAEAPCALSLRFAAQPPSALTARTMQSL
jgi:hypothetical protein